MRTIGIVFLFALAGLTFDRPSDSRPAEIPPPTTVQAVSVAHRAVQTPIRPDLGQSIPTPTGPPTTLPATECAEWYPLAIEVGWPADEWPNVAKIMWRESRCRPEAHNGTDPNGGSFGLMQINAYWCKPSKWTTTGWLQDRNVLDNCQDLYEPAVVLKAALNIYLYSYEKHGYDRRFGPWTTAHDI